MERLAVAFERRTASGRAVSSTQILDLLRAAWRDPMGLFWAGVAWLLDTVRGLGPVRTGLLVLLVLVAWTVLVWFFQKRLGERLKRPPGPAPRESDTEGEETEAAADEAGRAARQDQNDARGGTDLEGVRPLGAANLRRLAPVEILKIELSHSFVVLPFKPFQLVARGLKALIRWLRDLVRRRHPDVKGSPQGTATRSPFVATLGPSYLLGGLVTAGLYLAARVLEPLLAARYGLSEGLSFWQYLVFGFRPELSWYLPLDRFPYLAGFLAVLVWLAVWSLAATGARVFHWSHLGRDLGNFASGSGEPAWKDPAVLPFWRTWAGASELWRPDRSYRRWAWWLVGVAAPLLGWAWLSLGGDPYRLGPSEVAVAAVLWTSWLIHLLLRGSEPGPEEQRPVERDPARLLGWEDVLEHLERRDHVKRPEPFRSWRLVPPAAMPIREDAGVLSPLIAQLLSENGDGVPGAVRPRLRPMQEEILRVLALQGYVHTDPPQSPDALMLGREGPAAVEDRSGLRSRNLVVLAPEGSGKSTLALLAVANHALIHTRASLVVTADDERAETLARAFRGTLDASPLRWTVRVRSPGDDLMTDVSRGIVPNVVVIGLRDLVVTLLDRSDSFEPFLRDLGLLVIDDVEAFTGPREIHGQLAFRRLLHRVEELLGVEELGGRDLAAPQVLVLGTDSMHEASEWAQSLCGIDAVTRRFPEAPANGAAPPPTGGLDHRLHRLRDFRTETDELLSLDSLIQVCETLKVPWHYRSCGDGRRDMGRGPLLLAEEPRHHADRPEDACVVLLEGSWSEVEREVERLRRAGTGFARRRAARTSPGSAPEPIGLVTLADPDIEMAFTQLDREFALTPALATLPRPVLRPPTGRVIEPHLTADLTQQWTEIGDVVRIFGDTAAARLRRLARQNLLQAEERTDVEVKVNEYSRRVYVRAQDRAVEEFGEPGGDRETARGLLPPKVGQVELVDPEAAVAVRDRATLVTLDHVDAASASLVYYPGRIFRDARGTFVVVGRASELIPNPDDGGDRAAVAGRGDVLVEPILTDAVSSPRRQLAVERLENDGIDRDWLQELRQSAGGAFVQFDRVLLGREPIGLSLQVVGIHVEHVATYRLGPVYSEVRQRSVEPAGRAGTFQEALETVALCIVPDPGQGAEGLAPRRKSTLTKRPQAPRLGMEEARLLAAAMRAVVPSMYRGGGERVGVGLVVKEPRGRAKSRKPSKKKGTATPTEIEIYLFDTDAGGNGTARAIYRDGVALLLRLCRLVVERVLSLDRLLAVYDEWGDRAEIEEEARTEAGGGQRAKDAAAARRETHAKLRKKLLEWLDNRLPPEGGAESQRELARYFGSGDEEGEGDVIDLGRCWYSADGTVTDLVWTKHRWQHPELGGVMLDVGLDRRTYLEARRFRTELTEDPDELTNRHEAAGNPYGRLTGGDQPWEPQRVTFVDPVSGKEARSKATQTEHERSAEILWALGNAASEPLSKLAAFLLGEGRVEGELSKVLFRFVQGIPNAPAHVIQTPGQEVDVHAMRSPIEVLLQRQADPISKAMLLAVLFSGVGCAPGVFLSLEGGGKAYGAVSAKDLPPDDRKLESASFWADVPPRIDGDESHAGRFYPVDLSGPHDVGLMHAQEKDLETMAFLPLPHLTPPRTEGVESEPGRRPVKVDPIGEQSRPADAEVESAPPGGPPDA